MGPTISPSDAAKILKVPEALVSKYLATPAGNQLWTKARADGRVELLIAVRRFAVEGSPQAQKLLTELLAHDDTKSPIEQRVPAKLIRELLGRSAAAISHRVRSGDMIPSGPDRGYSIADLIGLIPQLWDKLATARDTVARLESQTCETATNKAEADRQLRMEQVRARKRENDIAEGRLVESESVRTQVEALARIVREQTNTLTEEIILKLSLPAEVAAKVSTARGRCLARITSEMQKVTNDNL